MSDPKNPKSPFAPGGVPSPWPKEYEIISPLHDSPKHGTHRDVDVYRIGEKGWERTKDHFDKNWNPIKSK